MLTLRAHQKIPVERARTEHSLALFMEAGTGKTACIAKILAEDFNAHKRIRKTLIFAPLTVCKQWAPEIAKFTKIPEHAVRALTAAGRHRVEALAKILEKEENVIVVTNYESVQIKDFYALLLKFSPEIVVLDESHRIKDSRAKRSKAIYPLCQGADRRFLLTGTPAPNSLLDIFGQYKALDPCIFGPGYWSFRSRYFYDRNAGRQFSYPDWVPHPWAAQEIGEKLKKTFYRVTRKECLDLPELQIVPIEVGLSKAQKKLYEEFKKDFVVELNAKVMSTEFQMVAGMRLQQMLCGFVQPDSADGTPTAPVWFDDNPRLDALMDIVDSLGKERALIWTVYRPSYAKIAEALEARGISYTFLTGEQTTDAQKQENKRKFTAGEAQILIANPAAAGEGITGLEIALNTIYYMRGYSALHYEQSMARTYRGGSEIHDKVVHYHLIAKGTIDEVIADALIRKINVQKRVLEWAKAGETNVNVSG
jgi:SNF2 family DNA or RNA helicase